MQNIIIKGSRSLSGTIDIHGAKNSVLPLLSATVLLNGKSTLHNCPDLTDTSAALDILKSLGLDYKKNGDIIEIFSGDLSGYEIPDELMRRMRSSVMFLGSILGRYKKAVISTPGGCQLGPRPIDIHISALTKMGVTVNENYGKLIFEAKNGLKGTDVFLDFPSVGATENVILAATLASGTTTLYNAAREPEIKDLTDFLNKAGAEISGGGSDTIVINGVRELGCADYAVMPDRIEAVTYMSAAAITGGSVVLNRVNPAHLTAVSQVFEQAGCDITYSKNRIMIVAPQRLKAVKTVRTRVYPGFPTDAGPMLISTLSTADGTSVFCENIFENRYGFVDELKRFGAMVSTHGPVAVVGGVERLTAAPCNCTDLRGGAALVIAALKAEGESKIGNIHHIKRGYQNIVNDLRSIGADILES